FIWSITYAGELSSLHLQGMLFWLSLEYLGVATIPVLWLMLALLYSGREQFVTTRSTILLFIVPVIIIVLVATNEIHHFVYRAVSLDTDGPFPMLSLERGPGYWINAVYAYVTLATGVVFLLDRLRHTHEMYRKQVVAMLLALLVPWVLNLFYQVFNSVMPFQHLDLTPYGFAVTGVVVSWAMYRYQLFDIAPAARERVVEIMADGLIVLDIHGRVVDANEAAARILGWQEPAIGKPAGAALARWPDLLELSKSNVIKRSELPKYDEKSRNKYYEVSINDFFNNRGDRAGKLILMHNITNTKKAEEELRESEEKFHSFFRTVRDPVFMTTSDGRWLEVNDAAVEVFGYGSMQELKESPVINVYAITDQRKELTEAIASRGFVKDMPVLFRRKNGELIDALLTAAALRDKSGQVVGFQGTVKDITEMKQTQQALVEANERLQEGLSSAEQRNREITLLGEMAQSIQTSRDMQAAYLGTAEYMGKLFVGDSGYIAEINADDQCVEVKASFGKPQGKTIFPMSECIALQTAKVHESDGSNTASICPHMVPFHGCFISIPLQTSGGSSWLLHLQHGNENLIPPETCQQWIKSHRLLMLSAGQELAVALSNVRLRETLHEQAIRDSLTGLFNRRYMEEILDQQLNSARKTGSAIGFIMADLDNFKKFNDTYGHEAGDLLLQTVANRIRNAIRVEDVACRYGGEEFLIILPNAGIKDTYTRAMQMREDIRNISIRYGEQRLGTVTISMGVSAFPDNGNEAYMLIRCADIAMYEAKQAGRDCVKVARET
ncbi:MAG: diguanylate cyclase, partial [Dehalococcoidia bacterium]|nr:diguanylate cyclase [Dehalococcoidia bacterium]